MVSPIIDIALFRFRVARRAQQTPCAERFSVQPIGRSVSFMQTILEKILDTKRQEVAERQVSAPIEEDRRAWPAAEFFSGGDYSNQEAAQPDR
jgi:hypothetical protein